ncbi:MAG TPA: hypothetical protein VHC22_07250 [Pirellulales bacterium]|nr:hypothetical protein [Pirellulales bacterium]
MRRSLIKISPRRAIMFLAMIGLTLATSHWSEPASHADSSQRASQDRRAAREVAIAMALDESTELDFAEQPLTDVFDYLKQRHQIEIQLDTKALNEAGCGSDTPVTRSIRGVTLESALDLILTPLDLTWIIHDEVLFITSKSQALNMIETRIYPVRDLLGHPAGATPTDGSDYESLVEVLAEAAAANNRAVDSKIRVFRPAAVLVITRPVAVHRRIEKLLKELRRAKADNATS